MKSIYTLALEAGLRPFDFVTVLTGKPSELGPQMETILKDRNPYFDTAYRERFGTQVHRIETSQNRLALGAVESALPVGNNMRRYRAVIFRCDGNVLYQTSDVRALDYREACVDLRYWVTHIDESRLLGDLCKMQMRLGEQHTTKAEAILAALALRQGP